MKNIVIIALIALSACQTSPYTNNQAPSRAELERRVLETHKDNFCNRSGEIFYEIQKLVDEGLSREDASEKVLYLYRNDKNEVIMHGFALEQNVKYFGQKYLNENALIQYGTEYKRCMIVLEVSTEDGYFAELDMSGETDLNNALEKAKHCETLAGFSSRIHNMRQCL